MLIIKEFAKDDGQLPRRSSTSRWQQRLNDQFDNDRSGSSWPTSAPGQTIKDYRLGGRQDIIYYMLSRGADREHGPGRAHLQYYKENR